MEPKKVSKNLLMRLPGYLEYLESLPQSVIDVSSARIARDLGLGAVMVRKDLAKVSDGGRRKLGYNRLGLLQDIREFLDLNSVTGTIVVGAGTMGQALLDFDGFGSTGLRLMAGFDPQPVIKRTEGGRSVYPLNKLEWFCGCNDVKIGIITTPPEQAQDACDRLVGCGICGIWNFTSASLNAPAHVQIKNENLALSLTSLRLQVKEADRIRIENML